MYMLHSLFFGSSRNSKGVVCRRTQETKVRSEPKGPALLLPCHLYPGVVVPLRSQVTITVRQAVEEEEGVPAPSMKASVLCDISMYIYIIIYIYICISIIF